ncbi:MAG: SprB repeat-containing protein, partial [Burkholderiales bacterium]|nr:SprB repeat-containing protein [Flavobacterium sp.]
MKSKITFLLLACLMFVGNLYSQFDAQHPDLRLCGSSPNYYLDVFNCTSNNFTLNNVYLTLTSPQGAPLTNSTCTIGNTQMVYVVLNYTSNGNNTPNNGRLFADLMIGTTLIPINAYLGDIPPGVGAKQIYGPFLWTCGQELSLAKMLVVWRSGGSNTQLVSYNCATYSTSQCELPVGTIISKPLAVQFIYKACRVGNNTTVNFTSTTNGGIAPYSFAWDFDNNGTVDSTVANPTFTYTTTLNTAKLKVTDTQGLTNTFSVVINSPTEIMLNAVPTHVSCQGGGTGSIDLTVSGGTPAYTYLWNNGATSQDISGLAAGTYTVTVTDNFTCQKTLQVIVNGGDSTNPIVTAPANMTIQGCNSAALASAGLPAFSASQTTISTAVFTQLGGSYLDASTILSITYQDSESGTCPKIVTRTFRVTDACNNVGTAVQTIRVEDTQPPVFVPFTASYTISCPAVPTFDAAKAIDSCDNFPVLTFVDVTTTGACAGTYSVTRTWTSIDACGNAATASQTIYVKDTVAPVIAPLPATSTISCPATPQFTQATATDACGSFFTLTSNDVTTPAACAGSYSITRRWIATDACGNISNASQTINVQDTTAPVITALPAPSTISCPATPGFTQAIATDACGSTFTLTSADITTPGACAGAYSVTRTWTATDACGNTSQASQIINVRDNTAPIIAALPAPSTISCSETPQFTQATATDACGSSFTLTSVDVTNPGACAGAFSITRTWTATDTCGNISTAFQTINVQDTTAPVIAWLPEPSTISCPATPVFAQATATDACGSLFTLTSADVTTPGACAGSYSVTRTWTATDACGNISHASQTINVQDTAAPVIAALPATSTISCPAAPQFTLATATDACGSSFTLTSNDVTTPGACAGSYSVIRTWTATDACGNISNASQTINVQDTTAPVIAALPATATISCPASPEFTQATATDACGSTFTLTSADVTTQGTCAGAYSITRTWTATDTCGNSSTASQT